MTKVMLRCFVLFYLASILAIGSAVTLDQRSEIGTSPSPPIGGPHGDDFDDAFIIGTDHKRLSQIKLVEGCEGKICRIFGMTLQYRDNQNPSGMLPSVQHGSEKLSTNTRTLNLKQDEYVNLIEVDTYRQRVGTIFNHSEWTRIGRIKFTTNKNKSIEAGLVEPGDLYSKLAEGAFLYFSGKSKDMIDQLTAHWIPTDKF